MSELLQSGQFPGESGHHPDADQLSAFIERALPAHEREHVLAHLALCQDCRETVALSLPEFEAQPAPAPTHRPWLRGWSIFVPAALALAASVFFVVHLHRVNTSVGIPAQVATSQQPLPIVPQQAPALSRPLSVVQQQARARTANRPAAPSAPPPAPAAIQRQQLDVGAIAAVPEPAPPPPAALAADNVQSAPIQAQAPANRVTLAAPAPTPPASIANAGIGSAAQTTTVSTEPPTVNAAPVSGQMILALPAVSAVPFKNPLPSGLAVSSIAASGHTLLAIDAHNAVFLSSDSGEHWTAVSEPWRDRAVRVSLVSRPVEHPASAGASSGREMAAFASVARLQPPMNASLSGVVTDAFGAALSGASVTIRNASTSFERTVTTDANGHYFAEGFAPGSYDLEAAAPGFATQRVAGVAVDASRQTTENLTLQVGSVSETVAVASEAEPIASPRTAKSKALKSPQAAALPSQTIFEITTDTGEQWTSGDGILWQRK